MARKYITPNARSQIVDRNGVQTVEWQRYLAGIAELSGRVAANVAELDASPTNEEIATAFNALLEALQDANLQETE